MAVSSIHGGESSESVFPGAVNERETRKVSFQRLADYIYEAPKNSTVVERADIPSAYQMWEDVPVDVLEAGGEGSAAYEPLQSGKTDASSTSNSPLSELIGKSLMSMLFESLFFAEIEESAAGSNETATAQHKRVGEDGTARQQPAKQAVNPLKDGEKIAEMKKLIADLTMGKADISDIPKAMAVSGAGSKGTTHSVASAAQEGINAGMASNAGRENATGL